MFDSSIDSYKANIAMVQKLYGAFSRRDMPAVLESLASDVIWQEPANPFNPAAGTRHGHEGFLEWARIGRDAEEILTLEPNNLLAGPDMVAVVGFMRCQAKPTGKVYESDFVHLITVKDGKVARFQGFFDTFAAGEAFRP